MTCIDRDDVGCLCESEDEFREVLTSCLDRPEDGVPACPTPYLSYLEDKFRFSCDNWKTMPSSVPGCTRCQSEAAREAGCVGQYDYLCLCQADARYLSILTSCISGDDGCDGDRDQTYARADYGAVCDLITSKEAGTATFPADLLQVADTGTGEPTSAPTGEVGDGDDEGGDIDDNDNNDNNNNGDGDGPETATVVGVVLGTVAGLAVLLAGGYWLFRKKRTRTPDQEGKASPRLSPFEHAEAQQKEDGILHEAPMNPENVRQPEMNGTPMNAPQYGYVELDSTR